MVYPRARLAVAASLFVGWLLFLLYLVVISRDPIVVSRPQVLVAELCVLAEVSSANGQPDQDVKVTSVLAPKAAKALEGKSIQVKGLETKGWSGPGMYLLPLDKPDNDYLVTPIPQSPGFGGSPGPIYRATDDVLRQFHEVR